jgi:hypothetical protein
MPLAALATCCSCKTNVSAATDVTTVFWGKDVQASRHLLIIGMSRFLVVVPMCLVLPTRSAMMRFPFLVCTSLPTLSLLPVLLLPCLLTVTIKFPFRVSHTVYCSGFV